MKKEKNNSCWIQRKITLVKNSSRYSRSIMSPCVTHPREELEEMSKGNPPSPEGVTESQHMFVPRDCGYRLWTPECQHEDAASISFVVEEMMP